MLNKDCPYFPCHKGLEDCKYCYCPIYPCKIENWGKWVEDKDSKIWDCSDCIIFHSKKILDFFEKDDK